ncbi:MAG: dihydropteroate synthase [Ruminococcaceae bacterium]|nr:dihydropteroate synthase [Oscillospiraceae bacterium]
MFSIYNCMSEKKRPLVMGILNVTPDSFFESGKNYFAESAFNRALEIESEGADILDIGGCSTAPGKTFASQEEELARLKTVLPLIPNTVKIPVSVDTFRVDVAKFALNNGVRIVNDESGCFTKEMAAVVKEFDASWIFMHTGNKTSSETGDYPAGVVADVLEFFKSMKEQALNFGIGEDKLCFDYGIGFGKSREDDLTLLKNTDKFYDFKPLLVGVSNKRVVGQATGKDVNERLFGTLSAESITAFLGADVIRTHNVKACVDAVAVSASIKKGGFING